MGFHHLDQYADTASGLQRLAPAARVLGAFAIALGASLLPAGAWPELVLVLLLVLGIARAARVPYATLLRRAAVPFGFLLLASAGVLLLAPGRPLLQLGPVALTDEGLTRLGSVLLRGGAAIGAGVLLVSTTRFTELVDALRQLRLPAVVTASLGLAYRFVYLLTDEIAQLQRAAASRNAGQGAVARRSLLLGIGASALTRSFARSERVHRAMLARGYSGALPALVAHELDARSLRAVLLLAASLALLVAGAWLR